MFASGAGAAARSPVALRHAPIRKAARHSTLLWMVKYRKTLGLNAALGMPEFR